MKKTLYLSLCAIVALLFSTSAARAYNFTGGSFSSAADTICSGPYLYLTTNAYAPTLTVETFFGDGSSMSYTVNNGGSYGFVGAFHSYSSAGTYTIKNVLYDGTMAVDSSVFSYTYMYCNTFIVKAYNDINANCTYDSLTEGMAATTMVLQVDSAGYHIDTINTVSGFYYTVFGNPGTVYTFKVLSSGGGVAVTCPASATLTFTVQPIVNAYTTGYFGIQCTGTTGLDVFENTWAGTGRHHYGASIIVGNNFCNPQNVTVTMHMSTKYDYQSAYPVPTSVTGHTLVWNLTNVSSINPAFISVDGEVPGAWNTVGDTVHTNVDVAPTTGDSDPTNNSSLLIDTVSGAYDPNAKEVSPTGDINPGTKLTYTIHFENTGNDTAFNIHVLDTLSNNVDVHSLQVLKASAAINVSTYQAGGYNIVKFDFPHINLLDTSHHGQNMGMFMYSINAKTGLAAGTLINNRAAIYFDFNDPIITNTVTNKIGHPVGVQVMAANTASVYPNPVSNELTINTGSEQYSTLTITNTIGQVMINRQLNGTVDKVNVQALPSGTYFISLKGASGVKTQQFQKL